MIDPVIEYSTTLGGSGGEIAGDIVLDSAGNAYVTGGTNSVAWEMPEMSYPGDFPNAYPLPTGQITPAQGSDDVFVTKINPAGTAVVYSTYWGGTAADQGHSVAVDAGGSAYVTGYTYSADFPTVAPVQPSLAGGFDAFVSKLNPAGDSLVYSTFLGGSGDEEAYAVAVDVQNRAHVVGTTESANFPVASALQPTLAGFWGNRDAFLTRVSANGTALEVSTYLGGGGDEYAYDVELDPTGRPHLTGLTSSADFPTAQAMQPAFAGYSDAFVTTLDASETSLVSSTYLGGNYADQAGGLALDGAGCTYVTGGTRSQDFPVVNAFQPTLHGQANAFLTKLCPGGSAPFTRPTSGEAARTSTTSGTSR